MNLKVRLIQLGNSANIIELQAIGPPTSAIPSNVICSTLNVYQNDKIKTISVFMNKYMLIGLSFLTNNGATLNCGTTDSNYLVQQIQITTSFVGFIVSIDSALKFVSSI